MRGAATRRRTRHLTLYFKGIFIMRSFFSPLLAAVLAGFCLGAWAQTAPLQVTGAWARASVPGQNGSGAFMTLQAPQDLKLVGASSPAAGVTQIHEMKLEGDTMRMKHLASLPLPAHQNVTLRSGGNHIMLMDLKQTLTAGSTIQIELQLQDGAGQPLTQTVDVPVRQNAPAGAAPAPAAAHGHHGS